jgi:hypothetical protein
LAVPTRPILARRAKNCHRAVSISAGATSAAGSGGPTDIASIRANAIVKRTLSHAAAAAAVRRFDFVSRQLIARICSSSNSTGSAAAPYISPDDLLTLATTKRISSTAVKVSLNLAIAAAADAAAAAADAFDLDEAGLSPVSSAYAIDPSLWLRLCANAAPNIVGVNSLDVTGMMLRKAIAEASRCADILVPVPVLLAVPESDGSGGCSGSGGHVVGDSLHWLLVLVLPAERAIECYDSRRREADRANGKKSADDGDADDRCWRAMRTVRTALVLRGLARYWNCSSSEVLAAAGPGAAAVDGTATADANVAEVAEPTGDMMEDDDDIDDRSAEGPWKLCVVPCAQQPQQQQQRGRRERPAKAPAATGNGTRGRTHSNAEGSCDGSKDGSDCCGRGVCEDSRDDVGGNASATYLLWFVHCILLVDDALSLTQPPPPGFRRQIVSELFRVRRR